jgi:hypothetical protein
MAVWLSNHHDIEPAVMTSNGGFDGGLIGMNWKKQNDWVKFEEIVQG